jgi:hypothetical protein
MVVACPHCGLRLKREKALTRRGAAVCPKCRKKFWLDPFQKLYPNQLGLTETQARYVDFVMGLADLKCGAAVMGNLEKLRNSLRESGQESPSPVVRRLFELALERCTNRDEEQLLLELAASFERFDRQQSPPSKAGRRGFSLRSLFNL